MKLLIEECLSPVLVELATEAGYHCIRVDRLGLGRKPDHVIMKAILADSWTFVTSNAGDFRPEPGSGSKRPCYVGAAFQAGLVSLNLPATGRLPKGGGREIQRRYIRSALEHLPPGANGFDNMIMEVDPNDANPLDPLVDEIRVRIERFP